MTVRTQLHPTGLGGGVELEPYWEFLAAGPPQISFHFCPDQLPVLSVDTTMNNECVCSSVFKFTTHSGWKLFASTQIVEDRFIIINERIPKGQTSVSGKLRLAPA